jgi:hypothetical protein
VFCFLCRTDHPCKVLGVAHGTNSLSDLWRWLSTVEPKEQEDGQLIWEDVVPRDLHSKRRSSLISFVGDATPSREEDIFL